MKLGSAPAHTLLVFATSSVLLVSCGARVPDESQALGLLDDAYAAAERGDFEALCALGGGNCEQILAVAGEEAVPEQRPTVAGTFVLPETQRDTETRSVGGRVVVLCGSDAAGRAYQTEVLVFYDEQGSLRAIEPVYWSGNEIAASDSELAEPPRPSCQSANP